MQKRTKNILFLTLFVFYFASGLDAKGAGVLPYTLHPKTGKALFLVGFNPWRKSSEDFGGHAKKGESYLNAAAREFLEEICFFLARYKSKRKRKKFSSDHLYRSKTHEKYQKKAVREMADRLYRKGGYIESGKSYRIFPLFIPYRRFSDIRAQKIHYWRKYLIKKFGKKWIKNKMGGECEYFNWIEADSIRKDKNGVFYATQAFNKKKLRISKRLGRAMLSKKGLEALSWIKTYLLWAYGYLLNYVRDFWN